MFGGCPPPGVYQDFYRILLRNPTNFPTILQGYSSTGGVGFHAIRITNSLSAATSINGFQLQGTVTGIQVSGTSAMNLGLTISNCVFNHQGGSFGMDFFLSSSVAHNITPSIISCTFTKVDVGVRFNVAGGTGNANAVVQPKFVKCKFYDLTNSVQMELGNGSLEPTFEYCHFYDNDGYVITNPNFGVYTNNGTTCFCSNTYFYHPRFINSVFYNNNGIANLLIGVVNQYGDISVDFINSTLWNNPSTSAGPAFNINSYNCYDQGYTGTEKALKIQNSILWDNDNVSGQWISLDRGMAADLDHSLVDAVNCSDGVNLIQTAVLNCNFGVKYNQNPQFINASGSTPNLRLLASSPARNSGYNPFVPTNIDTDLIGYVRIVENIVEMGAYEYCPTRNGCYPKATIDPGPIRLRKTNLPVLNNNIQLTSYPNPVQNVLQVKGDDNARVQSLQLVTIEGKVVKSNTNSRQINVQGVPKGMYLLKVQTDQGVKTLRVIKK